LIEDEKARLRQRELCACMEMVLYDATVVAEWGQDLRSMGFLLCPLFFFSMCAMKPCKITRIFKNHRKCLAGGEKKTFLANNN
jgi:hypothetical protein